MQTGRSDAGAGVEGTATESPLCWSQRGFCWTTSVVTTSLTVRAHVLIFRSENSHHNCMPQRQTDDSGKRISEGGGNEESSVPAGRGRAGRASWRRPRQWIMLPVSTLASLALPRLSLPAVLPPSLASSLLNLLHSGPPSAPTWHSVPTSIIHRGRCEGGERRV